MTDLDIDWFMRVRHAEIAAFVVRMEATDAMPAPGSPEFMDVFQKHLVYWLKLEQEGSLLGAGPLEPITDGVGLAILLADNRAEAEALVAEEPFAKLGFRRCTIEQWSLNEGLAVAVATGR